MQAEAITAAFCQEPRLDVVTTGGDATEQQVQLMLSFARTAAQEDERSDENEDKILYLRSEVNEKEIELLELREQHVHLIHQSTMARENWEEALQSKDRAILQLRQALKSKDTTLSDLQTYCHDLQQRALQPVPGGLAQPVAAAAAAHDGAAAAASVPASWAPRPAADGAVAHLEPGSALLPQPSLRHAAHDAAGLKHPAPPLQALSGMMASPAAAESGSPAVVATARQRPRTDSASYSDPGRCLHGLPASAAAGADAVSGGAPGRKAAFQEALAAAAADELAGAPDAEAPFPGVADLAAEPRPQQAGSTADVGAEARLRKENEALRALFWEKEDDLSGMRQRLQELKAKVEQMQAPSAAAPQQEPSGRDRGPCAEPAPTDALALAAVAAQGQAEAGQLEAWGGRSQEVLDLQDLVERLREKLAGREASARKYKDAVRSLKAHLQEAEQQLMAQRKANCALEIRAQDIEAKARRQAEAAELEAKQREERLKGELAAALQAEAAASEQLEQARRRATERDAAAARACQELAAGESELQRARGRAGDLERRLEEAQDALAAARTAHESVDTQAGQLRLKASGLEMQLRDAASRCQVQQSQLSAAKAEARQLRNQLSAAKAEAEEAKEECSRMQAQAHRRTASEDARGQEVEKAAAAAEAGRAAAEAARARAEAGRASAVQERDDAQRQLEHMQKQLAQLQQEGSSGEAALRAQLEDATKAQQELEARARTAEVAAKAAEATLELRVQAAAAASEQRTAAAEALLEDANQRLARMQASLKAAQEEQAAAKAELAARQAELDAATAGAAELQQQLSAVEAERAAIAEREEAAQVKAQAVEQGLKKAHQMLAEMKGQGQRTVRSEAEARAAERQELADLRIANERLKLARQRVEARCEQMEVALQQATGQNSRLSSEVQALSERASEREAWAAQLQASLRQAQQQHAAELQATQEQLSNTTAALQLAEARQQQLQPLIRRIAARTHTAASAAPPVAASGSGTTADA